MTVKDFRAAALVLALLLVGGSAVRAAESAEGGGKKEAQKAEKSEEDKEKTPLEKRLYNLYDALVKYTNTHNHRAPRRLEQLTSYLKEGEKGLINPETDNKIEMNAKMSGMPEMLIKEPAKFITFYADKDTGEKGRAVIFADKTIKYLAEKEFEKALAESKPASIPPDQRFEMMEREHVAPSQRRRRR